MNAAFVLQQLHKTKYSVYSVFLQYRHPTTTTSTAFLQKKHVAYRR